MSQRRIPAHQHADAASALRLAYGFAPAVVGWKPGGWLIYSPTAGAPEGVAPEMLVLAVGRPPIALSESGEAVLRSALG